MNSMYSTIILDHNKSKHNKYALENPSCLERGHNPNCGDDLTLQLKVENGVIVKAAYLGSGCAISQASMSIMIDLITHKTVEEGKALAEIFFKMVRGQGITDEEKEALEDSIAFEGLNLMPARAKCGTLGWHCLEELLK
jgi:nitrogen fixation NifU-like protein